MKCPFVSKTDSYSDCDLHDVDGGCATCGVAAAAGEGESAPNLCDDQTLIKILLDSADEAEKEDPFLTNVLEFAADRIKTLTEKPTPDPLKARYTLSLTLDEIVSFRENLIFVNQFCNVPTHMFGQLQKLIVYLENLTSDRR